MKKILFILILLTSQIFAQTTYYISSSQGNDANTGLSETAPWRTLSKLSSSWGLITAGDRILFKRGDTWQPSTFSGLALIEITNKNGTAANPIIIDAYGTGNLPIISDKSKTQFGNTLRFKGSCSYIYIRNLHIVGEILFNMDKNEFGTTAGMHNIKLNDLEIQDGRIGMDNYISTGPTIFSHVPNSNDPYTNPFYKIEIGGCTITDQRSSSGDDWINFIFGIRYIDSNGNPTTFANRAQLNLTTGAMPDTNIWIHDNDIRNSWSEIIDIPGGNLHLIERNKFIGSRLYGNVIKMHSEYSMITDCIIRDNLILGSAYDAPWLPGTDPGYDQSTAFGFAIEASQRCIIENNTLSARYPALFGDNEQTGQQSLYGTFKDNIIRNNNFYGTVVIYGVNNIGTWGYTHDQEDSIAHINTFTGNNYWSNSQWSEGVRVIKVFNNDAKNLTTDGSAGGSFDAVWIGTTPSSNGSTYPTTNEQRMNPNMVNPVWDSPYNPGTYTLQEGSPLIDAGSATGNDHIYDIDMNVRVQGVVDIGAYETVGGEIPPQLTFTPTSVNMGTVVVDEIDFADIQLKNTGTVESVTIDGITLDGDSSSFFEIYVIEEGSQVNPDPPYIVGAGMTLDLQVEFTGSAYTGVKTCNISINHNSTVMPNDPHLVPVTITVSDDAVSYAISGDTNKVFLTTLGNELLANNDFALWDVEGHPVNWVIDENPPNSSITETSPGSGIARISSTDGVYATMNQYVILEDGGRYLFEGDIDVNLGSAKILNGPLLRTWNAPFNGIDRFHFLEQALSIKIERGASSGNHEADFDYISIKEITSSWDATAVITATGNLTCQNIAFENGTNFSVTSATSFDLSDGETFSLDYSFSPPADADSGWYKDTLIISGINASNRSVDTIFVEAYYLSNHIPPDGARINLELSGISFPNTNVSASSDTTFKIWNDGDETLTIDSITVPSHYTLYYPDNVGDTTLAAGDSLTVSLGLTPTTIGTKEGNILFYHNGTNLSSPIGFGLSGVATAVETGAPFVNILFPIDGVLNYGTVEVGSAISMNIQWRNDGDETFIYEVSQYSGANFVYVSGGLDDSTEVDSITTLRYRLQPTTAGTKIDTIYIVDNSVNPSNLDSPYKIILTGIAIAEESQFIIDKSSYYFGTQDIEDADTVSFTITNNRATALDMIISMPASEQFTLIGGGTYSVFSTQTFYVVAQPTSDMYYEIDVQIEHNAGGVDQTEFVTVNMTGSMEGIFSVFPSNYSFGDVAIGQSKTQEIISYNRGRGSITVDSIYLSTGSVFEAIGVDNAILYTNTIINGGFDKDTAWVFDRMGIVDNKLKRDAVLVDPSDVPKAQQDFLTGLGPDGSTHLLTFDVSNHTGTGDRFFAALGGVFEMVVLEPHQYNNGKVYIKIIRDESDTFAIGLFGGNGETRIDNITLSQYNPTSIRYAPIEGENSYSDTLNYQIDGADDETVNIQGDVKRGNLYFKNLIKGE